MSSYYFDPDWTGDNNGTIDEPYLALIDAPWAAGNRYYLKRGVVHSAHNIQVGGSELLPIYIGVYGDGTGYAKIDGLGVANGLTANGLQYITIEDIEAFNCINGIVFFTNDTVSAVGVRVNNCYCHDNSGAGCMVAPLPGYASYAPLSDVIFDSVIGEDNGSHGVALVGYLTDGAIIRNSNAVNNGLLQNAWGIYMAPRGIKYLGSAWSLVSGTVYALNWYDETFAATPEILLDVAAPGRIGAGSINPIMLTEGTFGALNANEWAQSTTVVQIDIGENPNGKSIILQTSECNGGLIDKCEASNHLINIDADGVGIGFDHISKNGTIKNSKSHNNINQGIIANVSLGVSILSNEVFSNGYGISVYSTSDTGDTCNVLNNDIHDNGIGEHCNNAPKALFSANKLTSNTVDTLKEGNSVGSIFNHVRSKLSLEVG